MIEGAAVGALFTRELAERMRVLRRVGWVLQIIAGLMLVAMGLAQPRARGRRHDAILPVLQYLARWQ
jgi:sulfite exporter TauE/SafE